MRFELQQISPSYAKKLIEETEEVNGNFRKQSIRDIKRISSDMSSGRWSVNGETIKISSDGLVVDGLTRLKAGVMSGVAFKSYVLYDCDANGDGEWWGDEGRPRSFKHHLARRHPEIVNQSTHVAAVRFIRGYEKTGLLRPGREGHSNHELMECFERWKTITAYVKFANSSVVQIGGSRALFAALGAVACDGRVPPPPEFRDFVALFLTGYYEDGRSGTTGCPALTLRTTLLRSKADKAKGKELHPDKRSAYTILAWNAFLEGDLLKNIRWVGTGVRPQEYPKVLKLSEVD